MARGLVFLAALVGCIAVAVAIIPQNKMYFASMLNLHNNQLFSLSKGRKIFHLHSSSSGSSSSSCCCSSNLFNVVNIILLNYKSCLFAQAPAPAGNTTASNTTTAAPATAQLNFIPLGKSNNDNDNNTLPGVFITCI